MNALIAVRSNAAGMLSPTPAKRAEVAEQVTANFRANLLGRVTDLETLQKMQGAKAANESEPAAEGNGLEGVMQEKLDRDAFLRLLVLQMQNQDPMEPTDNSEMIAQLAQFSSLEQMENLNSSFQELSGNMDQLNFINANTMIGRQVAGIGVNGQPIEGTVESVQLQGSVVHLVVDGQSMSMAGVLSIE